MESIFLEAFDLINHLHDSGYSNDGDITSDGIFFDSHLKRPYLISILCQIKSVATLEHYICVPNQVVGNEIHAFVILLVEIFKDIRHKLTQYGHLINNRFMEHSKQFQSSNRTCSAPGIFEYLCAVFAVFPE